MDGWKVEQIIPIPGSYSPFEAAVYFQGSKRLPQKKETIEFALSVITAWLRLRSGYSHDLMADKQKMHTTSVFKAAAFETLKRRHDKKWLANISYESSSLDYIYRGTPPYDFLVSRLVTLRFYEKNVEENDMDEFGLDFVIIVKPTGKNN